MHYLIIPALIAIIYIFVVRPKIKQYRAVTGIIAKADAQGYSAWHSFRARLSGLKTVILGSLAAMMPQLPPILEEISGFTGWHAFLSQGAADKTAAVLAAATAITHVYGLVQAANIVPIGTRIALPGAPAIQEKP